MTKSLTVLFIVLILPACFTFAQENDILLSRRFSVNGGISVIPQKDFTNAVGDFKSRWWNIRAGIPLWKEGEMGTGWNIEQFNLTVNLRRSKLQTTLIPRTGTITQASIGGSYSYFTKEEKMYFFSASVGIMQEMGMSRMNALLTLTGIGSFRLSNPLLMFYGVNYSAVFGRDMFLPIIGMRWKLDDEWSMTTLLPLSASILYKPTNGTTLKLGMSIVGDRIYFKNNALFANEQSTLLLRINAIKISIHLNTKISEMIGLNVETGILGARKLWISADNRNIVTNSLQPSGYISIGIRLFFDADSIDELI